MLETRYQDKVVDMDSPRVAVNRRLSSAQLLLTLFVAPLAALTMAGCSESKNQAVEAVTAASNVPRVSVDKPPAPRVTLIMKTLTNPFFVEMERGARRAQQETQVDLQVRTATQETSIDQQIQLVQDEIKAGAQAIVIAPGDSSRLVPILKQAQDSGIRIVNIDNRLSAAAMAAAGMKDVPFISVDNEQGAYQAASYLVSPIDKPTDAAILEGIRSADNAAQRKMGAQRGLSSNKHVRLVASETANWKIDEAYAVTASMFRQHPKIALIFCANDMMAIGAIKYLVETGRTTVKVAGFDALDEARTAIRARQLLVTVDQQAAEQGYLGVKTALDMLQGKTVPTEIRVDTKLVTESTIK